MSVSWNQILLRKIIHSPCCEQFHVGTSFFPNNHAEGSVHPPMGKRLADWANLRNGSAEEEANKVYIPRC